MPTRLRNIIIYIIGFIVLVFLTYVLYHLGINFGRLVHNII